MKLYISLFASKPCGTWLFGLRWSLHPTAIVAFVPLLRYRRLAYARCLALAQGATWFAQCNSFMNFWWESPIHCCFGLIRNKPRWRFWYLRSHTLLVYNSSDHMATLVRKWNSTVVSLYIKQQLDMWLDIFWLLTSIWLIFPDQYWFQYISRSHPISWTKFLLLSHPSSWVQLLLFEATTFTITHSMSSILLENVISCEVISESL